MLLFFIILVVLIGIGYYLYATMYSKPSETSQAMPTIAPVVTVAPTQFPDAIQDESELDGIVDELDKATDEATMNTEVKGLQTDTNF